jgi:hypothetical protein
VVGIATCHRLDDRHYFHVAGEKYISEVGISTGSVSRVLNTC